MMKMICIICQQEQRLDMFNVKFGSLYVVMMSDGTCKASVLGSNIGLLRLYRMDRLKVVLDRMGSINEGI